MFKIIKTISHRFIIIGFLVLFCATSLVKAQVSVQANVAVLPPFSNNLNEYTDNLNRVMVTLQNVNVTGGNAVLWLKARISDGNNIELTTDPAKKPLQPFIIPFGSIKTLTYGELKDLIGVNSLVYSGISKQQVLSNGLPEGNYTICIEVYDFRTNELLSGIEPQGCSNMFTIMNLEAPTIQQPFCTETINATNPQQLIFRWIAPMGAPITTKYTIRMTEVSPYGRNPYEAMAAATYPYFFEQENIAMTTYLYTTAQPKLTKGRTYAFTVTASDPMNHGVIRNNGQSEVCWFRWGEPDSNTLDSATIPVVKPTLTSTVKGTLNYTYDKTANPSFPLKNISIALKVVYKKKNSRVLTENSFNENLLVNNRLASTSREIVAGIDPENIVTTNAKGEFEFTLKMSAEDTVIRHHSANSNLSENYTKSYYLQIYNPYYDLPATEFEITPGQNIDLGVIMAKVKTYKLNVNIKQIYNWRAGKILENMDVYLLRKNKSSDLPEKEGDLTFNYLAFNGYIVVGMATTKANVAVPSQNILENSVTFSNLVKNVIPGDNYILYARKHSDNPQNTTYVLGDNETDYENISFNPADNGANIPIVKRTKFLVMGNPPRSKVSGTLSYKFYNNNTKPAKPLANTKVSLVVQYKLVGHIGGDSATKILDPFTEQELVLPGDNNTVLDVKYTNSAGKFTFDFAHFDSLEVVNPKFVYQNGDLSPRYNGKLEKVIRIKVESPYYASPDDDIKVEPWSDYNAGNLTSYVLSYQLKVKAIVAEFYNNSLGNVNTDATGAISGVKLALYRTFRDSDIPTNEGSGINQVRKIYGKDMILVSEDYNLSDGTFTFKDLVRSNYPDDCYLISASTSENSTSSKNYYESITAYPDKSGLIRESEGIINYPSNFVVYNSNFTTTKPYLPYSKKLFEKSVKMAPRSPRVAGRVVSSAAPNGVKSAIVRIFETSKTKPFKLRFQVTDTLGYFEFENLPVERENPADFNSNINGPDRSLGISKSGYASISIELPILKMGTQYNNPNLQLIPFGTGAHGYVQDSIRNLNNDDGKGDPLAARVKIGDGAFVNTYNPKPQEAYIDKQQFKINAPKLDHQLLTIVPFDLAFPTKTFWVNIREPNQWLGEFDFSKLQHKVLIKVIYNSGGYYQIPAVGAKVKLLNSEITTNAQGEAYFEFTNNSTTNFVAMVTPTGTQSFTPKSCAFTNTESQGVQKLYIIVENGVMITGKVVSAVTQQPLKGAKVFLEQGNGTNQFFVLTNNQGEYQLNGVPKNPSTQIIKAVYTENGVNPQTYIGKSISVTIPASGNPGNVNFALNTFNEFDLTSLRGMPIEIDSIRNMGNSVYEVTGAFIHLVSNENFKLLDSNFRAPFAKMRVIKGTEKNSQGVFKGVPFSDPFGLDVYSIPIKIFNDFNGEVRPKQSVIQFTKDYPSGKGKIEGLVRIVDNSFNFPSSYMTFAAQDFYLGTYGQGGSSSKMEIPAFKAPGVAYPKSRFSIAKYDAKGFKFKLLGFNGVTSAFSPTESYIIDDTVALFVQINTTLPFDPPIPLNISAGKVILHHDKIDPIDNLNDLDFKLENWAVKGVGWKLATNSGGIFIKTGTINTGILSVPYTNMTITPDNLICEDYQVGNLSVGGVTPLIVSTSISPLNKFFGYDPRVGEDQKGHYKLMILSNGSSPVAQFGGGNELEGMGINDRFKIYVISLLSNGQDQFSFGDNHPIVPLYTVAKFKPLTIFARDNSMEILGSIGFDIPGTASNYQANVHFTKGALSGKAMLKIDPIGLVINGPGNVVFSAKTVQSLGVNGFTSDGFIEEDGMFKLKANLYRPVNSNNIMIKVDTVVAQKLAISSSSSLQKVYGKMGVINNNWDYFSFGGTLSGANGIGSTTPQKLDFTVFGDIKATNQSIGVNKINLPGGFGGISLNYDFKNSRLTGEMGLDASFNGLTVKGSANVLFDNDGWYFIAGGLVNAPGVGQASAGLLIGDYTSFTPTMQNTLMQFCYNKSIPKGFENGVHGFLFSGTKAVPVINIPSFHMNILVASMDLGFECGLDARMYMNFTEASTKIGIGMMAFAHAYFVLESSFCTTISAEARQEIFVGGLYDHAAGTFDFHGCGSLSINGGLEQCIGAFGVCGPCLSAKVEKSLILNMSLSSSNGIYGISVGSGNCSDK